MNQAVIELLGYAAAFLTTFAFLPQAIKTLRLKKTDELSFIMCISICLGVLLWLIYGILIHNTPLIMANGITFIFTATILVLKVKLDLLQSNKV